jgi:transposase InsO family protein
MNTQTDKTLEKNYVSRLETLVIEYEQIKRKEHPRYTYIKDFFKDNRISHQNFSKYYHRYLETNRNPESLKPQKRGPKYKARRIDFCIEEKIVELRNQGLNRFEIQRILKNDYKPPSLTTIYNYIVKHNLNKSTKIMRQEKVKIIKENPGDLYHVDCHNLGRHIIKNDPSNYYLVTVLDDCTRLIWSEVVKDIKSLTVMFSVLRSINMLYNQFSIQAKELMTDNGSEFGKKTSSKKEEHPFERMLIEMGIKHIYTRPYRPQTNGKVERFWKTIHYDLIEETDFDTLEELKDELLQYIVYYNEHRPHQSLQGMTPKEFLFKIRNASN